MVQYNVSPTTAVVSNGPVAFTERKAVVTVNIGVTASTVVRSML